MDSVLHYAIENGFSRYTSTLIEAWRISVSGLTKSFADTLGDANYILELGPDQEYRSAPIAAFAIEEAKRHRERGVRLDMFLGLLKYYRQAYCDIINQDDGLAPSEKAVCCYTVGRFFDRIEIGFCVEWSSPGPAQLDELQRANRSITNEKNKFLTIFESLPFPAILFKPDFQIANMNHSAIAWLGGNVAPGAHYYASRQNSSIEGNDDPKGICPLPEWIYEQIDKIAAGALPDDTIEKKIEAADGYAFYNIKIAKMKDISGQFSGILMMIQDFTEARKADEERSRIKEQLLQSDKMAGIGQLAAGVAHEINNPTGFVSSNLKTLGDYTQDFFALIDQYRQYHQCLAAPRGRAALGPELSAGLDRIAAFEKQIDIDYLTADTAALIGDCREGTERIKKIVMDLKDFAHPGSDALKPMDINAGLESTLNVVNNEIKYKATVERDFGDLPLVNAFAQQLNQVFMNILVNAAQAMEKDGVIRIRTRAVDGFAEVVIADNGCGIPEENLTKIFDPFFTTKEVGKGTGLGMHIAYNIVRKHNGTITVQSQVGQGTTFTVRVPVANPALSQSCSET